jgi:hypothetical protein
MSAAPQEALQRMLLQLRQRRDQVSQQIQHLEALAADPALGGAGHVHPNVLLALYLDMRSGQDVAQACTQAGWTLPGHRAPTRQVQPEDVYAAIRGAMPGASPALLKLAQDKLQRRSEPA